jgi:hypothetical protein
MPGCVMRRGRVSTLRRGKPTSSARSTQLCTRRVAADFGNWTNGSEVSVIRGGHEVRPVANSSSPGIHFGGLDCANVVGHYGWPGNGR